MPAAETILLQRGELSPAGLRLALRGGEVLLAVNGEPFVGKPADLASRFPAAGLGRLALTFRQGDQDLTVLADTADLGRWFPTASPARGTAPAPLDPDKMDNWEILRDADGSFDLHRLQPSLLALVAPPLWLLLTRQWLTLATLSAALMLSAAVSAVVTLALYLVASFYFWRQGLDHLRQERMIQGLHPDAVIAARSEAEAVAAYLQLRPGARFIHSAAGMTSPQGA